MSFLEELAKKGIINENQIDEIKNMPVGLSFYRI